MLFCIFFSIFLNQDVTISESSRCDNTLVTSEVGIFKNKGLNFECSIMGKSCHTKHNQAIFYIKNSMDIFFPFQLGGGADGNWTSSSSTKPKNSHLLTRESEILIFHILIKSKQQFCYCKPTKS